jgi:plasmid stabilization system protein ParE
MRILENFRAAMERLADMPQLGHLRRDLADEDIRFWPVHSYLIVYRPDTRPLQIIRVLSGFRHVASLLAEE